MDDNRSQLFDDDFLQSLDRRYAHVGAWAQPSLYRVARWPQNAWRRDWVEDEFSRLPTVEQSWLRGRLRNEEQFLQALAELETGAILCRAGMEVSQSPAFGGEKTPDLLVTIPGTGARFLVEVWTRSIPELASGHARQWAELQARVDRGVPAAYGLMVQNFADEPLSAPASHEMKGIVGDLDRALTGRLRLPGEVVVAGRYRFRVTGPSPAGSLRAFLAPPTSYSQCDSRLLVDAIMRKVRRYRGLVLRHKIAFAVVLAGEPDSGCTEQLVEAMLSGVLSTSMTLSVNVEGRVGSGKIGQLREANLPPRFDPCLSAVGWLRWGSIEPGELVIWPRPSPLIEFPSLSGQGLVVHL
jgi:hypothetical protein